MSPFRSLRPRLLAAFLAVALVPLALLAGWNLFEGTRSLERVQREALSHQCTLAALELESELDRAKTDLFYLSQLSSLKDLFGGQPEERPGRVLAVALDMMQRMRPRSAYRSTTFIDPVGDEVVRVVRDGNQIRVVPYPELRWVGHEQMFEESKNFLSGGSLWLGPIEAADASQPELGTVVRMTTTMFDDRDRRVGLLVVELSLGALVAEMRLNGVTAEQIVVIDARGAYSEHPPDARVAESQSWRLDLDERYPAIAAVTRQPDIAAGQILLAGKATLSAVRPLRVQSAPIPWWVATVRPMRALRAPLAQARWVSAAVIVLALVLAGLLASAVASRLSRPILALAKDAAELGRGHFRVSARVDTGDELEDLARAMDRMARELDELYRGLEGRITAKTRELSATNAELREAYEQLQRTHERLKESEDDLVQSEKLSSIGRLAASVAHEINNPTGIISMYAQMLREEATQPEDQERLDLILASADKVSSTVRGLLDFSRRAPREPHRVALAAVVDAAVAEVRAAAPDLALVLDLAIAGDLATLGDAGQLRQVFRNLIENAAQATGGRGHLAVRGARLGDEIEVTVDDDGPGIPVHDQQRVFEPFFTTKGTKGTGLGLAVVYGIVRSHHGVITAECGPAGGARFRLLLPSAPAEGEESLH